MAPNTQRIALLYDESAYVETIRRPAKASANEPIGLMGRQVAGKEFLDAYLTHGTWTELVALVRSSSGAESLVRYCQTHPSSRARARRLQLVEEQDFHRSFFPTPPATLLYTPCPPDPRFAWARQHGGPGAFALSGVTHTLCTLGAVQVLCDLVTAPYEPYDALICTSTAVLDMVRSLTQSYADYLRDRHGGRPGVRARLELIPLGVDPEKFRPATGHERVAQRKALSIAEDETVILFVGRLSHHSKAQPFPMFRGIAQAQRTTGKKAHLLLSGWAANEAILKAFRDGVSAWAPEVQTTFVDGTDPTIRQAVWQAADVFTSLSDSIQETFGLVILEAMASGLPVVASDWNGYRDLVVHGETGYLLPTTMIRDAAADITSRLFLGEISYDHFLAECSQTVAVNVSAAAQAYARLLDDADLRRRMGAAGHRRVLDCFTWQHVIETYEELWRSQERERRVQLARSGAASRPLQGPAKYPPLEYTFAGYPSALLSGDDRLVGVAGSEDALQNLLALPLTNHSAGSRSSAAAAIQAVLAAATPPRSIDELDACLCEAGVGGDKGRATLAWMLKYGLLRVEKDGQP